MRSAFIIIYKILGFLIIFFLLGSLFVFIETVAIENNTESFIDESGILQNKYEKSLTNESSFILNITKIKKKIS